MRESGHPVNLIARQGPYTHWNRDDIVEDAVGAGTDYLMMIDADMSFPPDAILRLLAHGKDVVGGFYLTKQLPPVNTVKMPPVTYDGDGVPVFAGEKDWTPPPEPFRCAALGTGFMLVNMRALESVPRPLFPCVRPVGEDVAFCLQAAAEGLEVWCDPTFALKHIGDYLY